MLPPHVSHCLDILSRAGFSAYPVGGCVRDLLLGRTPGDWDVATSAPPEQTLALFPHTIPTGLAHGTVTVVLEGGTVEVTTFRRETGYGDGRHPDRVEFHADLTQDLARRDFTVNAMALADGGTVIDPFGGQADLNGRLLRAVGDPLRRFSEDALRILRAVRFSAQLGFFIQADTRAAMTARAEGLAHISAERIVSELEKTLLSPTPALAGDFFTLGAMVRFGCPCGEADWNRLAAAEPLQVPRWAALCAITGLDIAALPVSRTLRRAILNPQAGMEKSLALTGADLQALGLRGTEIGRVQKALVTHVLAHPEENTPQALLIQINKER